MDTKQKGDIAEQAAILEALKRGWNVLKPVGDRLSYDLVYEQSGSFIKIQVKSAWFDTSRKNWVIDTRRTKTNRRRMIRDSYSPDDFDFALVYIDELNIFYIFPVSVFIRYASEIHLVETDKRQRKPQSALYRNAWNLLTERAVHKEICV
ncbi:MAG: group I intron-associated PD-(D/E)XK endonuclease [Candidatus Kapabacteria bacterium]|jgi:hypothetical protein|nr:group I intron-associated PD-(D/E)XK endonuclease [Candidatus Kapabacteria bacterium]